MAAASARVLLLGCEHLVNWDAENGPDILAPARQDELDDVVDRLSCFHPTKVAVEVLASRQESVDAEFAAYLAGTGANVRNETTQVGYRLARRARAPVYAIDANWTLDHTGIEAYFEQQPGESPPEESSEHMMQRRAEMVGMRATRHLADLLATWNTPPYVQLNDSEYLDRWLPIGAKDNWGGVDLVTSWYRRNLKIFANLRRVAAPGDRVVVVIGVGHVCSLRHFVDTSTELEVVDPVPFLRTNLKVRPERPDDYDAIDSVVGAAFGSPVEPKLVRDIRASPNYVPELALVAAVDDEIVGHVMISYVSLDDASGTRRSIASLSPLAVAPAFQRRGVGTALVLAVTEAANERGEPLVVLEGDPRYYGRFGFEHSVTHGIRMKLPDWAPAEAAQVLRLLRYDDTLRGDVVYPPAFDLSG